MPFTVPEAGVAVQDVDFALNTALDVQVELSEKAKQGSIVVMTGEVVVPELTMEAFMDLWPSVAAESPHNGTAHRFLGLDPGTYTVMALYFLAESGEAEDRVAGVLFDSKVVELRQGDDIAVDLYAE